MKLHLGIDVGFSRTKGTGSDGKQTDFISQIAPFEPVKFVSNVKDIPYSQRMVVSYNSEKFFVGESAGKQSLPSATIQRTRTVNREGELLLLGAMGNLIDNSPEHINLVVGLPVSNLDLKDKYIEMASGKHTFTLLELDGSYRKEITVSVDNIACLPQPFGSLFDSVLDNRGQFIASAVAAGNVGILDIGYGTTDFLRSLNLEFKNKLSCSVEGIGGFMIAQTLSNLIYDKYQERIQIEDIDPYVKGADLMLNGEVIKLTELRKQSFKMSAEAILSRLVSLWPDLNRLDLIIITGGASLLIGDYLAGRLGKMALVVTDPVFSNAKGYLKYSLMKWGGRQ